MRQELQPIHRILIQRSLSRLPIGHEHCQEFIEPIGVVGVNQVAQFVRDDILDAVSRRVKKPFVQRDNASLGRA